MQISAGRVSRNEVVVLSARDGLSNRAADSAGHRTAFRPGRPPSQLATSPRDWSRLPRRCCRHRDDPARATVEMPRAPRSPARQSRQREAHLVCRDTAVVIHDHDRSFGEDVKDRREKQDPPRRTHPLRPRVDDAAHRLHNPAGPAAQDLSHRAHSRLWLPPPFVLWSLKPLDLPTFHLRTFHLSRVHSIKPRITRITRIGS